jgi:hypothetical protein
VLQFSSFKLKFDLVGWFMSYFKKRNLFLEFSGLEIRQASCMNPLRTVESKFCVKPVFEQ